MTELEASLLKRINLALKWDFKRVKVIKASARVYACVLSTPTRDRRIKAHWDKVKLEWGEIIGFVEICKLHNWIKEVYIYRILFCFQPNPFSRSNVFILILTYVSKRLKKWWNHVRFVRQQIRLRSNRNRVIWTLKRSGKDWQ